MDSQYDYPAFSAVLALPTSCASRLHDFRAYPSGASIIKMVSHQVLTGNLLIQQKLSFSSTYIMGRNDDSSKMKKSARPCKSLRISVYLAEAVTVQVASVILRESTATHEIQRVTCILSPPFAATIRQKSQRFDMWFDS